jgi:rRNA-processing protein FCF1
MAFDRLRGNPEGKIVILDSSAIIMCFEFSIDLEDELTRLLGRHQITVPKPIIEELKLLTIKGKGKKKYLAKPALDLAKRYHISELNTIERGDNAVIYFAQQLSGIVVTNDNDLRKKLRSLSIHVIFLRGKKKLVLE